MLYAAFCSLLHCVIWILSGVAVHLWLVSKVMQSLPLIIFRWFTAKVLDCRVFSAFLRLVVHDVNRIFHIFCCLFKYVASHIVN